MKYQHRAIVQDAETGDVVCRATWEDELKMARLVGKAIVYSYHKANARDYSHYIQTRLKDEE